jgi:hypothetical protein
MDEDEPERGEWTNPVEFPPVELEIRWTRRRRAAAALGVVAFAALLAGSILTYRQASETSRSGDLDVCIAGAEARALVDVARVASDEDELPESFENLDEISDRLPWRAACERVLEEGVRSEDLTPPEAARRVSLADLRELRRIAG